jgi:hypothetical protein
MDDNNGDYELTPHKKLAMLERAISDLKSKKLTPEEQASSDKLLNSMKQLDTSIGSLVEMFQTAAESMGLEEKESEAVNKALKPVMDKLDLLIEQNQKIAKGVVAVADMVTDEIPRLRDEIKRLSMMSQPRFVPQPVPVPVRTFEAPRPEMPSRMPTGAPIPQSTFEKPPMPPGMESFEKPTDQKKGFDLGGMFKK